MALKNVPQIILKNYLKRYPIHQRLARFNLLKRYTNRYAWLQPILEEIRQELFPKEPDTPTEITKVIAETVSLPPEAGVQFWNSPYKRYRCEQADPLRCDNPQPTLQEDESRKKTCSLCNFPTLLPEKAEIRGQRGIYRIERAIGRRGMGRLYAATQLGVNQPVVIKEYLLLGRYFNADEMWQTKQVFKNLAGISLADGRVQDLRFLEPLEAIADDLQERCYIVMDERYACPTLNRYLTLGALSDAQVRRVLNQSLQTLEFLHGQKFRLGTSQINNGVVHGNLSLDSLLMVEPKADGYELSAITEDIHTTESELSQEKDDFFIYLCDLAIWEHLFEPTQEKSNPGSKSQDLISLGYIAFYLLAGKVVTDTRQPLNPQIEQHWNGVDPPLKEFILRLMQLEMPFESAATARQELQRLPKPAIASAPDISAESETQPTKKIPTLSIVMLLGALGLGIFGWLVWGFLTKPQSSTAAANALQTCCVKDVGAIPPGKYTYVAARGGIWDYAIQQSDLIQKGQTLEQRLKILQPKLQLTYQPATSTTEAIALVQSRKAAFAIAPLIKPLPADLQAQAIAYDGLAIFVAFSYSQRLGGLPEKLNGQITLEQLRQLYGGNISKWSELGGPSLSVNLYAPVDKEAVEVFEQRVLKNQFSRVVEYGSLPTQLSDFAMMRKVIRDFESQQAGGIGFISMSKVVGQCSVYPLALKAEGQSPMQAIIFSNGQAIDPKTDLCDKKGSYHANVELFKTGRYPLAYPIAVIYPRDNDRPRIGEKFAEMFKTSEGQRLLVQTGLVPLE
jgi:ABC-type phosphate transport system substrate-binding protein/serine/threonine protein kinase